MTATEPLVIRPRNSAGVSSAASGPSASMAGLSRTRPSLRLSNRTRLPPSAKLSVNLSHSGRFGCVSRRRGPPPSAARPSAEVTRIRPPMPRWMPRSGPSSEVSHHIDLPRRRAAVSVRPVSAARSSPGECGRQTNVSLSSTSVIRRCSASSAIRRRAVSTSGSSGIPSFLQVPVIAIANIRYLVAPVSGSGPRLLAGSSRIFSRRGSSGSRIRFWPGPRPPPPWRTAP